MNAPLCPVCSAPLAPEEIDHDICRDCACWLATRLGGLPEDWYTTARQWCPTSDDTAFAPPFGTIRQCRSCGCLVVGGPTVCRRCAEEP
jgi:hypothetical protein